MDMIKTKEQLIEAIKDFKAVEILARKSYEQDIATFNNFEILDAIKKIKTDEDEHINLLDELLELL